MSDSSLISQAILCFLDKPKYASLTSHQFTAEEYQVLHDSDILMVLDKPSSTQELLSAENLLYCGVLEMKISIPGHAVEQSFELPRTFCLYSHIPLILFRLPTITYK